MASDVSTPNLVFREPKSSIAPHIALYLVQIIALASPPFRHRRAVFNTLIVSLAGYALTHPHFTNDMAMAQPFNIGWSFYLATLAKLNLSDPPEANYWHIDKPAREATSYATFGWMKFKWAFMLMLNTRGIRWNHQVKNVPKLPKETKTRFLLSQALKFVKNMVIADFLFQLGLRIFWTTPDGRVGAMNSKYMTLRHDDWRWSFVKCLVFGATPYFMMSMQYAQFAFLAVLFGFSQPADWPPMFNPIRGTTTVRDFWGRYWHQQLRHVLAQYNEAFCAFFRIPKGTNMSSYMKLWLAFIISGFFHAVSSLQMPFPDNLTPGERSLGFWWFFIWNVSAITLEDFLLWIVKKTFPKGQFTREGSWVRTVVGYLWVSLVIWQGLPLVGDMCLRMRVGAESPLPFSLSQGFVKEYVPIPP
ncbi:putative toxin biosynthesis protein [Lentithecium fluviatile CBS 122367]|uniref:Putative toxin biosynthesis protein n=1 Tax=Lentithecium fluviatile CBS 122367 TaxID=1168545 RepID=A0A6G1IGX6_9PLEO|nr:putative toxin biosynthesis protein [Lentithecium fluviatile CBS 122367]